MPVKKAAGIQGVLMRWKGDLENLQNSLKDKGGRYFQRPLVVGGLIIFSTYWYLYKATGEMAARMETEMRASKATAQYAEDYENLQLRLTAIKAKLPKTKVPADWLLDAVRSTLKAEGIVPLATSRPKERTQGGYRFISIDVRMQSSYRQIASWIARLERSKSLLHVEQLNLAKEESLVGENTTSVVISTIVQVEPGT